MPEPTPLIRDPSVEFLRDVAAASPPDSAGKACRFEIPAAPDGVVRSGSVAPEEWPDAIRCLVGGDRGVARRVLDRVESGSLRVDAIEAIRGDEGGFSVAAIAVRNPGRTLGLVLSPLHHPQQRSKARTAIRELVDLVANRDAALLQAMFDPSRRLEIAAASETGFRHLARLRFMEADLPRLVREEIPRPPEIAIEPCGRTQPEALATLLARTYERTLDCPGLAGLRRTEDVLDGHRGSGRFAPELWFMLRVAGAPAGLSLFNPNPEAGCTELVYFGLVPEVRGQGLGTVLLRHALARLGPAAPPRIALAVDDRNAPALKLYRRHGFVPGGLRVALVRPLA